MARYGVGKPPFREDQTPRPEDPYGIAKYGVEQELRVSHEMFGLPYIVFRPHSLAPASGPGCGSAHALPRP